MAIVGQDPSAPAPEPEISPEVEEIVKRHRQQRGASLDDDDDAEGRPVQAVLKAAAKGEKVTSEEAARGIEHFLADEAQAAPKIEPTYLKLNLGTKPNPNYLRWGIMPVEDTTVTRIRKESTKGTRAQRRSGQAEVDEALVARKLVVEATVDPDLGTLARSLGLLDPTDAVYAFFKRYGKTGLITQLSSEILSISGWDDEDISEVEAARG